MRDNIRTYVGDESGERLDVYLARLSGISRSQIQDAIQNGNVQVNGTIRKSNYRVSLSDSISFTIEEPAPAGIEPEDIQLDILYQDSDLLVINKPQGMVVHPAPGNNNGTLVNALLYAVDDLSGIGGVLRPGIVHRIDKMTSGLIMVAKNDVAHASLSGQLKSRAARRAYISIVEGNIKQDEGVVDAPIGRHLIDRKRMAVVKGGREAVTHWRVIARTGQYTLIQAGLETGRTHQIRVHMKHIKHPVAGDEVYGSNKLGILGQALHAYRLEFDHPSTGEHLCFIAKAPEYFLSALKKAGFDEIPDHEALKV